jgi:hypothetical protein
MIALFTVAAGLVVALICWHWSLRSLDGATRMALVVSLGVAASAFNIVVPIANVEATTTVVLCTALVLGAPTGAAVGLVAVIGTSITGGVGSWTTWQVVGMAVVALLGDLLGRVSHRRTAWFGARSLQLFLLAALATCAYDVLVTVPTVFLLAPMRSGPATERIASALLLGLPFTLVHVVFVAAFTALAGPSLTFTLGRARLRLGGAVVGA